MSEDQSQNSPDSVSESDTDSPSGSMHLRRAPKYRVFILLGMMFGFVLGYLAYRLNAESLMPQNATELDAERVQDQLVGAWFYTTLIGGVLGSLVGAGIAVFFDRQAVRRHTQSRA